MRQLLRNTKIHDALRKHTLKRVSITARSILTTKGKENQFSIEAESQQKVSFSSQSNSSSLQERGILDEHNLLKFDTIHELQSRASIAFADNPIFGKYVKHDGEDAKFEYMTYSEFGDKVDTCRTLLKDLGKISDMINIYLHTV